MSSRPTTMCLTVASLLGLAACGGGGGGGAPPAPVTPTSWIAVDPGPSTDYARGMAAGPDDSTYVAGWFGNTQTWDLGKPSETTRTALKQLDGYLARRDASGALLWLQQIVGTDFVEPIEPVTLADGSCVVAGESSELTIFAPGQAEQTFIDDVDDYFFLARYLTDGTLAWVRKIEGGGDVWGSTLYSDGSFAVCGRGFGTMVFGGGTPAETTLDCTSGYSDWVARYDADGTLRFAVSATDCHGTAIGSSVAALPDGTSIVGGSFTGTVTFAAGTSVERIFTSTGVDDGYMARLGTKGDVLWARQLAGTGRELLYGATSMPDGTVVLAGSNTSTSLAINAGEPDVETLTGPAAGFDFLYRVNAAGTPLWSAQIDHMPGGFVNIAGVVGFPDNSVGIAGAGSGTVTVDPGGPAEADLPSFDVSDLFLAIYDASGDLVVARRDGGAGIIFRAEGATTYPNGSIGFAGAFQDSFTVDQGGPSQTTFLGASGEDTIVIKYNPDLSHDG